MNADRDVFRRFCVESSGAGFHREFTGSKLRDGAGAAARFTTNTILPRHIHFNLTCLPLIGLRGNKIVPDQLTVQYIV